MPRLRRPAVALLVLALGVAAVLIARFDGGNDETGPERPGGGEATQRPSGEIPVAPELGGVPPEPPPAEPLRRRLVGRVSGPDEGADIGIVATPVRRRGPESEPAVRGHAARDGSFELDVGPMFGDGHAPLELEVRAIHPDLVGEPRRVKVGADEPVDGVVTYRVDLRVRKAAVILGRVQDGDGRPLPGAKVSVHGFADGLPANRPDDTGETDDDGLFRLRAKVPGRVLLVAAVDRLRPGAAVVQAVFGTETWTSPVLLLDGEQISGRVLREGDGVAGMRVSARSRRRGRRFLGAGEDLLFVEGRVERVAGGALTVADGSYLIVGLAAGTHLMALGGRPEKVMAHMSYLEELEREVDAPAEGVDFEIRGSLLVVEVRIEGEPVSGALVDVSLSGDVGMSTGPEGTASIVVLPETEYDVTASADGFETAGGPVVSPAVGAERREILELVPLRPRGSLEVTLLSPPGLDPVRRAGFALFVEGRADNLYDMDVDGVDGVFRVVGIDPGRYRLVVRPGGGWSEARGHWLEEEAVLVISDRTRAQVTLTLRRAGRLRIHVTGRDGKPLRARCAIRDASGARVPVRFRARRPGGSHSSRTSIVGGLPNDVEPALPAGRYEVELSRDGHETRVLTVDVEAGKTTEIEEKLFVR